MKSEFKDEDFLLLSDWIETTETILISKADLEMPRIRTVKRTFKGSIKEKFSSFLWNIRWNLSNFILERE